MLQYLPGCDVKKKHPKAIAKIEQYMKNQDITIAKCCRVKDKFLEADDTIINNCTLCDLIMRETHPDNTCLSLYEYVLENPAFPWADHREETITVQDCWRTRNNQALQKAVRQCLQKMHYTIIEVPDNYEKTKYCGVWLNTMPTDDCIAVAPNTMHHIIDNYTKIVSEEEKIESMKKWTEQYTTEQVLVYCNGCERGMKLGGGAPIHLVELLAEGL